MPYSGISNVPVNKSSRKKKRNRLKRLDSDEFPSDDLLGRIDPRERRLPSLGQEMHMLEDDSDDEKKKKKKHVKRFLDEDDCPLWDVSLSTIKMKMRDNYRRRVVETAPPPYVPPQPEHSRVLEPVGSHTLHCERSMQIFTRPVLKLRSLKDDIDLKRTKIKPFPKGCMTMVVAGYELPPSEFTNEEMLDHLKEISNAISGIKTRMSLEQVTTLFRKVSKGKEELNMTQFQWAMGKIGIHNEELCNRMFVIFDSDKSGTLDFREFLLGMAALKPNVGIEERLHMIFKIYDYNDNGFLTDLELFKIINACAALQNITAGVEGLVRRAFQIMDNDGDNVISFHEFVQGVRQIPEIMTLLEMQLSGARVALDDRDLDVKELGKLDHIRHIPDPEKKKEVLEDVEEKMVTVVKKYLSRKTSAEILTLKPGSWFEARPIAELNIFGEGRSPPLVLKGQEAAGASTAKQQPNSAGGSTADPMAMFKTYLKSHQQPAGLPMRRQQSSLKGGPALRQGTVRNLTPLGVPPQDEVPTLSPVQRSKTRSSSQSGPIEG